MFLLCYKKPSYVRFIQHYHLVCICVDWLVPRDYGEFASCFVTLDLLITHICYSTFEWSQFASLIVSAIFTNTVCRHLILLKPLTEAIIETTALLFILIPACLNTHAILQNFGLIYVQAELPRSSNEKLLNSLKESVLIIE